MIYEIFEEEKFGVEEISCVTMKFKRVPEKNNLLLANESQKKNFRKLLSAFSELSDKVKGEQKANELLNEDPKAMKEREDREKAEIERLNRKYLLRKLKRDVETSTQDRERKIKEKKIMLGKKSIPIQVVLLRYSLVVVFITILFVSVIELLYRLRLASIVTNGQEGIASINLKGGEIPKISYYSRILNLIAT